MLSVNAEMYTEIVADLFSAYENKKIHSFLYDIFIVKL